MNLDDTCEESGCTALHHAALWNRAGAIDALVEAGASMTGQSNDRNTTPLHYAVATIAPEAVVALLRHGAPNRVLQGGVYRKCASPLHCAAQQVSREGAAEMVDLLMSWGADVLELDVHGNTAAEMVGSSVSLEESVVADAKRVCELLVAESA